MPKAPKPYWIKERHNPQLGVYYVRVGQLSVAAAKKHNSANYGSNTMLRFDTEAGYNAKIAELIEAGERIH